MGVLELNAVRFIRPMKVGRTGALLLGCEDDKRGSHESPGEDASLECLTVNR